MANLPIGVTLDIVTYYAATDTVTIAQAAFDAAVANWPHYNSKLRKEFS